MGVIATVAGIVLAISFVTFVAFFGRLPVFRHTPIAWLHRLVFVGVPGALLALDRLVTAGRLTTSMRRFGSFLMNDKHPTVVIFYLALLAGSEYLAVPTAWPLLGTFPRAALVVLVVLPYVFLYLAVTADPGTVTFASLRHHMQQYPYDYALFWPGARCRTCNLLKPPRSKHCSVCKRCVARLDHHCIFINNCVGAGNHHWFLLLLLSTGLLTAFGAAVGLGLVSEGVRAAMPGWSALFWRARGAGQDEAASRLSLHDWLVGWSWGLQSRMGLGSVGLLALLLCPLVWGLLVYNLWNMWEGQTTNESLKWSDWRIDMAEGLVFRRRLGSAGAGGGGNSSCSGMTRWPVEAQHVLVRTLDGRPPPAADTAKYPGVGDWAPVWRLGDVENIYNIGFVNTLRDVFLPNCHFTAPGLPSVGRRGRRRQRGDHLEDGGGD